VTLIGGLPFTQPYDLPIRGILDRVLLSQYALSAFASVESIR
jgi:hypothetical protein